jgi:hypothetical protein
MAFSLLSYYIILLKTQKYFCSKINNYSIENLVFEIELLLVSEIMPKSFKYSRENFVSITHRTMDWMCASIKFLSISRHSDFNEKNNSSIIVNILYFIQHQICHIILALIMTIVSDFI